MARSARQRRGSTAQTCEAKKKKCSASTDEVTLLEGDCFEVLASLEAESVDAIITDPPYGIGFQSARWDSGAIRETAARAGEDRLSPNQAFEVWARLWATECSRVLKPGAFLLAFGSPRTFHRLASGIEDGGLELRDTLMWLYAEGMPKFGRYYPGGRATTLKPAFEPVVLARRKLDGTTGETIARYGTGALNVEDCRVGGRLPANVILGHDLDCEDERCAPGCPVAIADACAKEGRSRLSPSRFLYCPKASRAERDAGCEGLPRRTLDLFPKAEGRGKPAEVLNPHPTVKPLELMRWLVRLLCPPGGLVLDPTCGSGSTGAASVLEGRRFVGIEFERAYLEISAARIAHWAPHGVRKPRIRRAPLGRRR
jgi:DNA modification methylase